MTENKITIEGRIIFEPPHHTKKHNKQNWKRIVMVVFEGDVCEYYASFIKKRYNLTLNKPLRGAHVSFVNDRFTDIGGGDESIWESVKNKWDGQKISVILDLDVRSNGEHWWLCADSSEMWSIRKELMLGNPYFSFHMSIGYANELNVNHSEYIVELINKFGEDYV